MRLNLSKSMVWFSLAALPAASQIPTGIAFENIYDQALVSFNHPTFVGGVPRDANQLIVVERPGGVHRLVKNGTLFEKRPWFSVDANTSTHWDGAWALEFHPRFLENRLFYVIYRLKGTDTRSVIEEWTCEADLANPRKVRAIIHFTQKGIHSSGDIKFGPDGYLYSSQADRNQQGLQGGQLMGELWGKVIRIDVDRKDPGLEYAIPDENPFKDRAGIRPEIWASGFRVPWRFSFDRLTGDIYLGDVGDVTAEEVNLVLAGRNYGSGTAEGTCSSNCAGLTNPIASLPRGCVIGGFVYRNDPTSAFYGAYIYADYQLNSLNAFKLNAAKNGVDENKAIAGTPPGRISAMGQDAAGNFYIATYRENPADSRTHIYRLKHAELRPAPVATKARARSSVWARRDPLAGEDKSVWSLDGRATASPQGGLYFTRDAAGELRKFIDLR